MITPGWCELPGGSFVVVADVVAIVLNEGRDNAVIVLRNGTRVPASCTTQEAAKILEVIDRPARIRPPDLAPDER